MRWLFFILERCEDMRISFPEHELQAVSRLQGGIRLIEQIVTFNGYGKYRFQELFPEEHAIWVQDAEMLRQSDVPSSQRLGYWMLMFVDAMAEADRCGQSSRGERRQITTLRTAAEELDRAYNAFMDEVTR